MNFEIIKDVLLVLLGGFVTFTGAILVNKLQRLQPIISWRKFPDFEITSQKLSGSSWLIENTGKKSAKNVKITFDLPRNSTFEFFEVESSENAMDFIINEEDNSKKTITVPNYTQNVDLSISCLISGLNNGNVGLSIIGEDVIGSEKREITIDIIDKWRKKLRTAYISSYVIISILVVLSFGFMFNFMQSRMHLEHTKSIADLHERVHDYDSAIKIYKSFMDNNILFKNYSSIQYNMAKLYAKKSDAKNAIIFLKSAVKKQNSYNNLIKNDKDFDNLKTSKDFQNFLTTLK